MGSGHLQAQFIGKNVPMKSGWYQEWGKPAQVIHAGDVVHIPANVKHWHGAAKDSAFQHLAIEVDGTDTSTEWCEAVAEADYDALP